MTTIPKGTIKRVIVNRHVIAANKKHGRQDACITIQTSRGSQRAQRIHIRGQTEVIYRPDKPLKCGATVWIETKAAVQYEE